MLCLGVLWLAVGCTESAAASPAPVSEERMMAEVYRHVRAGRLDDAVNILSEMIGCYPDSPLTVRAYTRVWSNLEETDPPPRLLRTYRAAWLASAPGVYDSLIKSRKLIDGKGMLDPIAAVEQPDSLQLYVEQGFVLRELGRDGRWLQLDGATTVFSNAIRVARPGTELWWVCKYEVLATLVDRGTESDIKLSKVGLENLERSNPEFDANKYGMKNRFLRLKRTIEEALKSK
jgi:hypothetical protein